MEIIAEPVMGAIYKNMHKARTAPTPTNTWGRQPKNKTQDPTDVATWTHPEGTIKRQIDYIMANRKFRNCVRKTHVVHGRRRKLDQRKHAAVRLGICRRLTKTIEKPVLDACSVSSML